MTTRAEKIKAVKAFCCPNGFFCTSCRGQGVAHCAYPNECEGAGGLEKPENMPDWQLDTAYELTQKRNKKEFDKAVSESCKGTVWD